MDTLARGFTGLTFSHDLGQSVLEDKTFREFYSLLNHDQDNNLWIVLFVSQEYPDVLLMLQSDSFTARIVSTEPGRKIDFDKLRKDLQLAQDYLSGSDHDKAKLFKQCNGFVSAHVDYVRAATAVTVHEMYDRLIDRFYGHVPDPQLVALISSSMLNREQSWPSYNQIKAEKMSKLKTWQRIYKQVHYAIVQIKSSTTLKVFQAKLKSALERHDQAQHHLRRRLLPSYTHIHNPPPYPSLTPFQRRTAVAMRNVQTARVRIHRNRALRQQNMLNVHQIGNQGRLTLSSDVIHALVGIQDSYSESLFQEQLASEVAEYKAELVAKGMGVDEIRRELLRVQERCDAMEKCWETRAVNGTGTVVNLEVDSGTGEGPGQGHGYGVDVDASIGLGDGGGVASHAFE